MMTAAMMRFLPIALLSACSSSQPVPAPGWEGCLPDASLAPGSASIAIDVGLETTPEGEADDVAPRDATYALDTPDHGLLDGGPTEVTPAWQLAVWPFGGAEGREAVYLTRRTGPMRYRFDLPDGLYTVTLELIDTTFSRPSQRVFSVQANGAPLATALDIAAAVGEDFAFDPAFAVEIRGEVEIAIGAETSAGGAPPLVGGLRIEPASADAPPAPTGLEARASVGANLLRWDPSPGAVGYELRRDGAPLGSALVRTSHFVDRTAPVGTGVRYEVRAIGPTCRASAPVASTTVAAELPTSAAVRVVEIEIADADLRRLDQNRASDDEVEAVATIDGVSYSVQVRNRGGSTRFLSKPGLRLDFADRSFEGREHWHLTAEIVDPTGLWQRASQAVLARLGALAPRTETVLLVVNAETWGPYAAIEAVREEMLEDRGLDPSGSLYRVHGPMLPEEDSEALAERYPRVGDDSDASDLSALLDWIAGAPESELAVGLAQHVDLATFVPYLAGQILVANFDVQDGGHFVYRDPAQGLWLFVPWDFNNQVWTRATLDPAVYTFWQTPGTGNLLWSRALGVDAFRDSLADALERAIAPDGAFGEDATHELVGAIAADLEPEARRDPWRFRRRWERSVEDGPATLEAFAAERRAFLADRGLARLDVIGHSPAHVVQIGRDDGGTWIELENRSSEPLAGALSVTIGPPWTLPGARLEGEPLAPGQTGRYAVGEAIESGGILLVTMAREGEGGGEESAGRLVDMVGAPTLQPGETWDR
jgi:spore coat protein H